MRAPQAPLQRPGRHGRSSWPLDAARVARRLAAGVALAALLAGAGCQLGYFLMAKEPKRKVPAEYDKLGGKNVAIVVWADQATLDEDYAARYRVADTVRYALKQHLRDVKFVDIREVTEFQENSGLDWEGMSNADVGRRFKADLVLRVDLLEYTTRAPDAREVRKGRVRATVAIYDARIPGSEKAVYSAEVGASYPADQTAAGLDLGETDILQGTLAAFGDKVAQKFYEHEVSY